MKKELISILQENCRISDKELARRLGVTEDEVRRAIADLEKERIIRGYTVVVNDTMLEEKKVKALIEVKVTPTRDGGFDAVAKRIARFPEVIELSLVSGGFDLLLTVEGDSLQDVAGFVSEKLSTIGGVLSTSTSFMLKRYKRAGMIMDEDEEYDRLKVCP